MLDAIDMDNCGYGGIGSWISEKFVKKNTCLAAFRASKGGLKSHEKKLSISRICANQRLPAPCV